jgi:DNA polymerase III subunit gamma/tau
MNDGPSDRTQALIEPQLPAHARPAATGPYRVLARVYRPQRFSELIGQDVLVRSLSNAIRTSRVAHAFLLTGIRGIGKTTTARIIARALNCIGPDGAGGPTPEPCGQCEHCRAIAEDRHIDVLEMDAATRTGIDDIREIVDSVRYAPTSARCKVYIIDEVHMLSEKAFNGLLKTLEEPPPQARFIFATTEVRKVPVTILSRCQRFDLRRIEPERLIQHLTSIAARESVEAEPEALALIARAAEGSVRDALSLLDQAIALSGDGASTRVGVAQVQDMLGLADRTRVLDLFERIMRGDVPGALACLSELYDLGVEPDVVVHDLLEICHWLTRLKVTPGSETTLSVKGSDGERGRAMAESLVLPVLARAWQMLLKGLDELRLAPDPLRAAEMLLVRLAYAADLPPPRALAKQLAGPGEPGSIAGEGDEASGLAASASPAMTLPTRPQTFDEVVRLFRERREPMLHGWLHGQVGLVAFRPGRLELYANGHAAPEWPQRVAECLSRWTDQRWYVSMVDQPGAPSLAEQAAARKQARIEALSEDPRVKPILESFPGARIVDVRPTASSEAAGQQVVERS